MAGHVSGGDWLWTFPDSLMIAMKAATQYPTYADLSGVDIEFRHQPGCLPHLRLQILHEPMRLHKVKTTILNMYIVSTHLLYN
jgi:hypothetical protein